MHISEAGRGYTAGGTINPCRLLKLSGDRTVIQATDDNDTIIGVSGETTRRYDATEHALVGEQVQVIELDGSTPKVQLGGTVAAGAYIVSDANGQGVTWTGEDVSDSETATAVNGIGPAIVGGASGEKVRVKAVAQSGVKVSS
jgi:hypothetical protein